MKSKIRLLLFLLLALTACDSPSKNWSEFTGKGLSKTDSHYNVFRFFDDSHGVLAGATPRNFILEKGPTINQDDALICITNDGGKTWEEHLAGKGFIDEISFINGTYLYLKKIYNHEKIGNQVSGIYKSHNLEEPPSFVYSPPEGVTIQNIQFISENEWLVTFHKVRNGESLNTVSLTKNSGQTWNVLHDEKSNRPEYGHAFLRGSIFSRVFQKPEIIKLDLSTGQKTAINFDTSNRIQKLKITKNQEIWAILENGPKTYLVNVETDKAIELPATDEKKTAHVFDFDIVGKNIFVVIFGHTSIVGASKIFFHSADSGITWQEENLPNDLFASKFTMKENGEIFVYSLSGQFQKRLLTN